MKQFRLSEIQATYILDTPLRRLTKYDKLELETEQEQAARRDRRADHDPRRRGGAQASSCRRAGRGGEGARRPSGGPALIDGDLKEVLAASKPAGPLEVADDPCQVILSATGLVARTAAESEEATEGSAGAAAGSSTTRCRAVVHSTARGQVLLVTNRGPGVQDGRAAAAGAAGADRHGVAARRHGGERAGAAGARARRSSVSRRSGARRSSPGLALGTRQGVVKVCAPEWPVRSDEFEVIRLKDGDEVVGATWLTDGSETLAFVTLGLVVAAVRREAGAAAGSQGRRDGRAST